MRSRALRYRRSSSLVCYWRDGRLVLHNYANNTRVPASAPIVDLLSALDRWTTPRALAAKLRAYDPPVLQRALQRLHELSFVQRSDHGPSAAERALDTWREWSPEAAFFHLATKDAPYAEPLVADAALARKARIEPPPPPIKAASRTPSIALAPPATSGSFARTLTRRRTWRSFGRAAVGFDEVSTLLGLTWGVQRWAFFDGRRKLALKTSPSGGARHNIEAYLLALRTDGIAAGLYHYDPDRHALARLPSRPANVSAYVPHQTWYDDAGLIVFMTALFARAQWRSPAARAYRNVLLEAGHFCQTFCLLATSLELAPFCTAAFAESILERDLGIDGIRESVIYACGVGRRPKGVAWAPWFDGRPTPRLSLPAAAKIQRSR